MTTLLRHGSAEKDIRDYLTENGYYGRSARFDELELHGIERPGWLQVFRFSVRVKPAKPGSDQWLLLFGAMRDDERFRHCVIECSESRRQRDELLDRWSVGLTKPTYGSSVGKSFGPARTIIELLVFLTLMAAVLFLLSLLANVW